MEPPVIYRLDENDSIEAVDVGWLEFASHNGAPELRAENVVGRRLVEFMSSATLQGIWTRIMARVRETGRQTRVPFRCDSPDLRRYAELEIVAGAEGRIEHRARVQCVMPRDHVALLHTATPRSEGLLKVCSQCKRLDDPGEGWVEVEDASVRLGLAAAERLPRVIHDLCDACFESLDRLGRA